MVRSFGFTIDYMCLGALPAGALVPRSRQFCKRSLITLPEKQGITYVFAAARRDPAYLDMSDLGGTGFGKDDRPGKGG